ncbi:MAG TPA: outer membrane protein assembly factor BamA [bacterium]|nr:outer membrane protein assembly factor BamA [bacterium]
MRVVRPVLPAVLVLVVLIGLCDIAPADIISGIEPQGNEHMSRDRILLGFGLRVGEELTPEGVREGIRRLYEMGHFSDIRVEAEPQGDGSVHLIVMVVERPKIASIDISGNDKISESDIESVLRMEEGAPYEASRVEDSRVAILDLYESKGFPYTTVTTTAEESAGNRVGIDIAIDEQLRVVVKEIRFAGNESLDSSDLEKVMETKEDRWWRTDAFFDREVLEEDLLSIAARYREAGYIDAVATGYETEYVEDGERVILTITVDEGGLYTVAGVEWIGASEFAVEALDELTKIEVGKVYEPPAAETTIRSAYDWYGERGYIHARIFKVEDVEDDYQLRLQFHVDEADPAHIGQIHIVGNERTKEKVIRRELVVSPGDLYQTSEIIASQRKIANLGFFNGPMVEFTDSTDPNDIDLVFTVEERQTGRAGVGVSHTSEKGITGFIELTEGNLFGNGQYMDLKWEFGKQNSEIVLGFTEPWFMNRRLSVGFDLYDTNDKRTYSTLTDEFFADAFEPDDYAEIVACDTCPRQYVIERERRGGDLRVGLPLLGSRNTMVYTKYTLEQFKQSDYANIGIDTDLDGDSDSTSTYYRVPPDWEWRSGLTATLVRRTTDRRFHPRLGSYTRFSADLFGWAFGGDVEYQRYILDVRKYVPSLWVTTLMLRGRGGLVTGYGGGDPNVPDDTRFELGGVGLNGVRGYDNRSILPGGNDLYGGRTMLLGTAELKFPITGERSQLPLHGLFFVDAGNTWESGEDTEPTEFYWGAGAGLRVEVPVLGNLGVDFGYGFDEEIGRDWVVHYQFGLDF